MSDTCHNELYCEIGRVAVAWSKIDDLIIYGISHFSKIPIDKAQCMFVGINSHATLSAFQCLLGEACDSDDGFCGEMSLLIERIITAKEWRNDTQHNHIELIETTARMKKTEKANKTQIRIKSDSYNIEEFKLRCEEVSRLSDDLKGLVERADSIVSKA